MTVGIDVNSYKNSARYYQLPVYIFEEPSDAIYIIIFAISTAYPNGIPIDNSPSFTNNWRS